MTNNNEIPVSEKIRLLRVSLNLTLAEFSELIGVTISTVHRWEQGKHPPYQRHINKIEEIFDVKLADIQPIVKWNGATNANS